MPWASAVAAAWFHISTILLSKITVRSNGASNASLGFRCFTGAERTIQGYEAMHMIRKGQVRWLAKGDVAEQVRFIKYLSGLTI